MSTMKSSILFGIILLASIMICAAMPMQLSGENGKSILENIVNITLNQTLNQTLNHTLNQTNTSNASEQESLWSWGKVPVGHTINASGEIEPLPSVFDPMVTLPPQAGP